MNADQGRVTGEFEYGQEISEFNVILKFSITDAVPLWRAAAQRLLDQGLDAEDVDDTLGPIDDPVIRDCLLALTMPDAIHGCRLEEFEASRNSLTPVIVQSGIVLQERKAPSHTAENDLDTESDWRTGLDVMTLRVTSTLPGPDHVPALPN